MIFYPQYCFDCHFPFVGKEINERCWSCNGTHTINCFGETMKNTTTEYTEFLKTKEYRENNIGFKPIWMPDWLFDFQQELTGWSIRKGQSALFEDCGLGKTPQQLVWAENVRVKTKKNILIITPLAVSHQTIKEAKKFDIKIKRTQDGTIHKGINITNYERLKSYSPNDFVGVVCDESSILKNFDGKTRTFVTDFLKKIQYKLLCTATPAPNDFTELGTSSEALGNIKYSQMLAMFFTHKGVSTSQWILKGHAKKRFWHWVSSWARAVRKPSDLGYKNNKFELPKLQINNHIIPSLGNPNIAELFISPAITLHEQRNERRQSLIPRCQKVMELDPKTRPYLIWCHLNDEADYLEKTMKDAIQISGRDDDDSKEEKFVKFSDGRIRVLITKPRIGGFGLNWQHCSDLSFFPSHSYEQFYQCIRRCWRFGQIRNVNLHIVSSEREKSVVDNMIKKEKQSDEMYQGIVREMSDFQLNKTQKIIETEKTEIPKWLQENKQ